MVLYFRLEIDFVNIFFDILYMLLYSVSMQFLKFLTVLVSEFLNS